VLYNYDGYTNKNNLVEKTNLYFNNDSMNMSKTFRVFMRVFTQQILQVSLKQAMWFNKYSSLNFKVAH